MTILELVQDIGYEARRKAACHGGEYCSPCPFCKEGEDRFLIWPQRHNKNGEYQGGRFTCRVCDKHGDAISFLREIYGLGYREACIKLNVPLKEKSMKLVIQSNYKPKIILEPNELWKEKMELFVTWCSDNLLNHASTMDHVTKRGITFATIKHFKLGYNPGEYGCDIFREYKDFGLLPETKTNGKQRKFWLPRGIVIPAFSNGLPIKKIAMVLCTEEHKNFDLNQLDADVVLMRPYNGRCILPKGVTYPESFRNGPVIKWLWV